MLLLLEIPTAFIFHSHKKGEEGKVQSDITFIINKITKYYADTISGSMLPCHTISYKRFQYSE